MNTSKFAELGLAGSPLAALAKLGFETPTPIQAKAIPLVLDGGDLIGIAQTGTGKTGAFGLPLIQALAAGRPVGKKPRALILAPTRELAVQINDSLAGFAQGLPLRSALIIGGVSRGGQAQRLHRGVDIVIGTPGRIVDLMQGGELKLDAVTHFVLDEADRMLDLGFIGDIRKIAARLPAQRQSLLFSATMPKAVESLAHSLLREPRRIEATPVSSAPVKIEQQVYFVPMAKKRDLLSDLLGDPAIERVIVFTRTKHGADRVVKHLEQRGIEADAIHGNKSQNARQRALGRFRDGQARVLVATDIAARGIDVQGITHVVNFDLPNEPESYVHRIGRTARAGATGIALSFCDGSERGYLKDIEKLTGQRLVVANDVDPRDLPQEAAPARRGQGQGQGRGQQGRNQGGGSKVAFRQGAGQSDQGKPDGSGKRRPRNRRRPGGPARRAA
ncbi:ATP-dependent RNA helicase RhlE [Tistlia consotensis]|uniref:ATP-dependent RNA helicase RhlE n=1 Tax=Tistlia consotensis USBA 355 TaxID=560819 RepID=A0A1Y6C6A1_9PROT|nr:DEAD/DEAH box helicase [Tistlia consotensis]SMF38530.1 ATP-dependent RNA helicase RhlE [Tistlia consotensis USBA 355]SNR37087.1 ATP-dependent RNA helicase RhlE [Tistlia consotensis]